MHSKTMSHLSSPRSSLYILEVKSNQLGVVVHALSPRTQEAKTDGSLSERPTRFPQSEFQDN